MNKLRAKCMSLSKAWRQALVAVTLFLAAAPAGIAQEGSLEGTWTGGGSVSFASGAKEQARCRAHYRRSSKAIYLMRATCATASGKATQTASLRSFGNGTYRGGFYNSEYDVSGTITVVLRGNEQTVRLSGAAGSGYFRLRR